MRRDVAVVVLACLLTGCSSASLSDQREPAPTGAIDRAGAPPVAVPRNLSSREADPCRTLLSTVQIRRLGYDLPGDFRRDILGSPTCTWREKGRSRDTSVSVVVTRDLFVDTYRNRFLPVFRPLEITGLPAVDIMSSPGALVCTTTVGVADGQALELNTGVGMTDGRRDGDPCEEGHRVAEEIISTLPLR